MMALIFRVLLSIALFLQSACVFAGVDFTPLTQSTDSYEYCHKSQCFDLSDADIYSEEGAAAAIGDIDGDGQQEIAVIYNTVVNECAQFYHSVDHRIQPFLFNGEVLILCDYDEIKQGVFVSNFRDGPGTFQAVYDLNRHKVIIYSHNDIGLANEARLYSFGRPVEETGDREVYGKVSSGQTHFFDSQGKQKKAYLVKGDTLIIHSLDRINSQWYFAVSFITKNGKTVKGYVNFDKVIIKELSGL
ncbi:hypothetical protein ACKC9G_14450 [Pokkaliibacter sp. CJK22405]|uniref:hypothetical protein n=1 Tax=Pokkaliibacter sp. CJK22405 TaxID=3384615 RepID=UPI00398553B2